MPDDDQLTVALAQAIWAADVLDGTMFTAWPELGELGQDTYRRDAERLLKTTPKCGVQIRMKEK